MLSNTVLPRGGATEHHMKIDPGLFEDLFPVPKFRLSLGEAKGIDSVSQGTLQVSNRRLTLVCVPRILGPKLHKPENTNLSRDPARLKSNGHGCDTLCFDMHV